MKRFIYIAGLGLAAVACPSPGRVVPAGVFAPSSREAFAAVARRTMPGRHEIVRFRWRSDDGRMQLAGAGAARIAPPDSLRLDISASLGIGRAVLILAGERMEADPEMVTQMLPDRFALWTVLGYLRAPEADRFERLSDGSRAFWRTTDAAGRVTTFELRGDTLAGVVREERGRLTQQLRLERDAGGLVLRAQLDDHAHGARFVLDVTGRESSGAFPDATWRLRS